MVYLYLAYQIKEISIRKDRIICSHKTNKYELWSLPLTDCRKIIVYCIADNWTRKKKCKLISKENVTYRFDVTGIKMKELYELFNSIGIDFYIIPKENDKPRKFDGIYYFIDNQRKIY